jgi:hypothetical protein
MTSGETRIVLGIDDQFVEYAKLYRIWGWSSRDVPQRSTMEQFSSDVSLTLPCPIENCPTHGPERA